MSVFGYQKRHPSIHPSALHKTTLEFTSRGREWETGEPREQMEIEVDGGSAQCAPVHPLSALASLWNLAHLCQPVAA